MDIGFLIPYSSAFDDIDFLFFPPGTPHVHKLGLVMKEYGQAVSGVIKVTTKEGSDRVEGKASFKRDYLLNTVPKNDYRGWRDLTTYTEPHNIDIVKLSLSGPDPISAGLKAIGLGLPAVDIRAETAERPGSEIRASASLPTSSPRSLPR